MKRQDINRQFVGLATISKGKVGTEDSSERLLALDFIGECPGSMCKLHQRCKYVKTGPCRLRKQFAYHIMTSYIREMGEANGHDLNIVGALLVPLWDQLVRFKIEEASVTDIMTKTGINPIFRAIRETIRSISKIESDFRIKRGRETDPPEGLNDLNKYGDPNYYRELMDAEILDGDDIDVDLSEI